MGDLSAVLDRVRIRFPHRPVQSLMESRLRELRTQRGWTQEELGRQVGVSRQAIIAIETGRHDPSLDLAYRLAARFGQPVESLFPNPHS
ncbi:helix-turn-helix transcriptional regulator [Sphingomonas sp. DT-207]|uniref:helix-turn-helix transcriptional regulator n=1 Tax=Sphingomonas sp. DT-207 TaxID=3396167 RepID=UPI003F193438